MSTYNWKQIDILLEQLIDDDVVPGCALSIRLHDIEIYNKAYGLSEIRPNIRQATTETIWDLASITKVLCTAHLYMTWANNGQIDLESPISKWLPHAPKDVRIVDCLSHSSGYPNWRPFYSTHRRNQEHWGSPEVRESFLNRVVSTPLNGTPTVSYAYSDIGFMALCAVAEARFGKAIHVLWQEFLPAEARDGLFWGHPNAAATEDCPIRNRVIKGEVHDLNAAVLGGKSTHAGLFGTASTLTKVGSWPLQGLHGRTEHLESQTVRYFWGTKGAGSHCLGWDTPSPSGSTASNYWPKNGVGHLGFTGTSLWIAPTEELVVGFTSNRVHPNIEGGALPGAITGKKTTKYRAFRPALHHTILKILELT
jgi:serine-type D-Ala-D-Ala carboxypeptidase